MKVLMLNDFWEVSGAEKVFRTLARELSNMGHDVSTIVYEASGMLPSIVDDFKPDIIHQHNCSRFGASTLSYAEDYPFVQTVHDYWPVCRNRGHFLHDEDRICDATDQSRCGPCTNYLVKLPMPEVTLKMLEKATMVTVSAHMMQYLTRFGYQDVRHIHNGLFPEPDIDQATDEKFIFCAAKAPDQYKGAHLFAEMAVGMPYRFVLAGGGRFPGVEGTGILTQRALKQVYKRASIVVMPSIWEEPNGLPIQESMMYGKPLVAFASGGIPEYVKNFVVPAKDVKKSRDLIDRLMKDDAARALAGAENRAWYEEHFTARKMAEKYLALYEELAGRKGA